MQQNQLFERIVVETFRVVTSETVVEELAEGPGNGRRDPHENCDEGSQVVGDLQLRRSSEENRLREHFTEDDDEKHSDEYDSMVFFEDIF